MPPDPSLLSRIPTWLYGLLFLLSLGIGPGLTLLGASRTSRVSADTAKEAARDRRQEQLVQDMQDERDAMRAERDAIKAEAKADREASQAERAAQRAEHERQMAEMQTLMREQEERHLLVIAAHQERERLLAEFAAGLRIDIIEGKGPPPRDWPV